MTTRPWHRRRDQDRRGSARSRPVFSLGIGTKAAKLPKGRGYSAMERNFVDEQNPQVDRVAF